MTITELDHFMDEAFPQMRGADRATVLEAVGPMHARVRLSYSSAYLRPGGTISGPAMMGLVDHAFYIALLAHIGPVALAVTTNLNINFLKKPGQRDLIADARILKLGQRLAVGDVTLRSDGDDEPVAHATVTYSIPKRSGSSEK
jgi:uncharacterized protein (TIGR00369 family)